MTSIDTGTHPAPSTSCNSGTGPSGNSLSDNLSVDVAPIGNEAARLAYLMADVKRWELLACACRGRASLRELEIASRSSSSEAEIRASEQARDLIAMARSTRDVIPADEVVSVLAQQVVTAIGAVMEIVTSDQAARPFDYVDGLPDSHLSWEMRIAQQTGEGATQYPLVTLATSDAGGQPETASRPPSANSALILDSKTVGAILSLWLVTMNGGCDPHPSHTQQQDSEGGFHRIIYHTFSEKSSVREWIKPETRILEWCTVTGEHNGMIDASIVKQWPVFGVSSSPLTDFAPGRAIRKRASASSENCEEAPSQTKRYRRVSSVKDSSYFHPSAVRELANNDFPALRGLTQSEMVDLLRKDFGQSYPDWRHLSVMSKGSLEKNCALEFFASFILALTGTIERVKGETRVVVDQDGGFHRTNTTFSMMANAVVSSGLASDEAEALTVIIPAFAARGLLP